MLIAARAAGVTAIDGPHLGVADDDEFRSVIRWACEAGFDGKWVIHPAQLDAVLTEVSPVRRRSLTPAAYRGPSRRPR